MNHFIQKVLVLGALLAVLVAPSTVSAEADVIHPETFGSKVGQVWQNGKANVEVLRIRLRDSIEKEQARVRAKNADPVVEEPAVEPTKETGTKPKPGVNIDVTVETGIDMGEAKGAAEGAGSQAYLGLLSVLHTIASSAWMFYGIIIVIVFFILRKIFHRVSPHVGSWE
jgi:hypothetical protein